MTFGTANSERYGHCTKDDAFSVLDAFYSKGGNFIDTANVY
jgi:aryl-alcohol dehydrogenase-like predicted oxidoreductase